jgi:hypothetical protein
VLIQGAARSTSSSRGSSRVRHGSRQPHTNRAAAPRRGSSTPAFHHRSTTGVSSATSTTRWSHGPPRESQRHSMSAAPAREAAAEPCSPRLHMRQSKTAGAPRSPCARGRASRPRARNFRICWRPGTWSLARFVSWEMDSWIGWCSHGWSPAQLHALQRGAEQRSAGRKSQERRWRCE